MQLDLEKLKQMTYYATSHGCLRQFILRYFGEQNVPERCDNCSVCEDEPFEVDTGRRTRRPRTEEERQIRREERAARRGERRNRRLSEVDGFTAWERALFENLKMLRQLIASEKSVPAYTVFSDAALIDMVHKHPTSMDGFLDVSGVGLTKQEQYGQIFLSVIRDGREPNDAMLDFQDIKRQKLTKANKGSVWSSQEEEQLKEEYLSEVPMREIAQRHERTVGGIKARLQKLGLIE